MALLPRVCTAQLQPGEAKVNTVKPDWFVYL